MLLIENPDKNFSKFTKIKPQHANYVSYLTKINEEKVDFGQNINCFERVQSKNSFLFCNNTYIFAT